MIRRASLQSHLCPGVGFRPQQPDSIGYLCAMSGAGSEPVSGDGAGPVHPQAQAKPKAKGRGKAAARPKLDLDKEIQEANMLATMSRKLMKAARSIERNNKKSRSRLIRKAGKLSPEDLERLAVLKVADSMVKGVPVCLKMVKHPAEVMAMPRGLLPVHHV